MSLLTPWKRVIILKPTVAGPGNFDLLWNPDIYDGGSSAVGRGLSGGHIRF